MFTGHSSFTFQEVREKVKIPDGFARCNPFGWSCKAVTEWPSFLALATAMARHGTTVAGTGTTGRHRSTPQRMVGT